MGIELTKLRKEKQNRSMSHNQDLHSNSKKDLSMRSKASSDQREKFHKTFLKNKNLNLNMAYVVMSYGIISLLWGSISIWKAVERNYVDS